MPTNKLWHFYGYDLGTRAHHWNASLSIISKYYKWNMDQTIHIIRAINIQTVDDNRCCTQNPMLFNWGKEFNFVVWSTSFQMFEMWWERKKTLHPTNAKRKVHAILLKPKLVLSIDLKYSWLISVSCFDRKRNHLWCDGLVSDICKFLSFERSCMKLNTYIILNAINVQGARGQRKSCS